MKTTGEQIIDAIINGALCHASCATDPAHNCVVVWSSGAAEQLDAIVSAALAAAQQDTERLASAADEVLSDYIISKRVEAGHPCPENMVVCVALRAAIAAAREAKP